MSMTVEQLANEALALSHEERALLADKIVGSLETNEFSRWDELWAGEARRRIDEVRSGAVKTIPGDEGLAQVRHALGR